MTTTNKSILLGTVLALSLGIPSVSQADNDDNGMCAPGVLRLIRTDATYKDLHEKLNPETAALDGDLAALEAATAAEQKTAYDTLATDAKRYLISLGATFTPGTTTGSFGAKDYRLVITEDDGTVVLDSSKPFDNSIGNPTGVCSNPGIEGIGAGATGGVNCVTNWQYKTINENHNSRIAIADAQLWPCGVGAETKYSSTVGYVQHYVAIRLTIEEYLHSEGTARLSK